MKLIENVKVKRVKIGDRTQINPEGPPTQTKIFKEFIDLPNYTMISKIKGPNSNRKVDILVSDDEAEEIEKSGKFRLVKDKIKKKYRGQKKWDNNNPLNV